MKRVPRPVAFFLLCALALSLVPAAIASDSGRVIWEDGGTIYIRPDFNSKVIDSLAAGTPVTVIGTESNFLEIEYYDSIKDEYRSGWINIIEVATSATPSPSQSPLPTPTPVPKAIGTGFVLCQSLSMRATPDTSGERIQSLSYEAKFDILADLGEWYHIYVDGRDGFVQSLYALMNPQYFIAIERTPALSHPSETAKRVALLEPDTQLAIIAEIDDYYVVSLRGASAFIAK